MSDLVTRIAQRARARRLGRTVRIAVGAAAVGLVAFLAWVVVASPWLTVRTVDVEGASGRLEERVRDEVAAELDRPLVRVDLDGVARRVESIPQVRSAQVARDWPRALTVTVERRLAAAYLPTADPKGDGFQVVDREGVVIRVVDDRPADLPRLAAPRSGDGGAPDPDRITDALAVLDAAPREIVARAVVVDARTPDDIRMELTEGGAVHWGSASDLGRKTQVLTALMGQEARVYDVSAPDLPTTRD